MHSCFLRLVLIAGLMAGLSVAGFPEASKAPAAKEYTEGLANMQSLSGQPVENKRLNVKDFGAKGDGIADDTAAIQSALDMAKKSTTVYFPAGVYNISRTLILRPSNGVRLVGDGNATVLAAQKSMQDLVQIKRSVFRFAMENMTVDANERAEVAIRLEGGCYTVFNSLYITNPRDTGLYAGSLDRYAGNELIITDCYFTGMRQIDHPELYSKTGIKVERMSDCIIHNSLVRGFAEVGMDLDASDLLVSHVHVYKLPAITTKTGIRIQRRGSAVVNCQIDNMTDAYIEMLGETGVISGNLFVRTAAVFGYDKYTNIKKTPAVLLGNDKYCARGVTISGNSCYSRRAQVEYQGPKGTVDGDNAGLITAKAVNCDDVVCVDNAYGDLVDRVETRLSGAAVIPAGKSKVFVPAVMLGKISQVQLTPHGMIGCFWSVENLSESGFEIRLSKAVDSPATFFWTAQSACSASEDSKAEADFH